MRKLIMFWLIIAASMLLVACGGGGGSGGGSGGASVSMFMTDDLNAGYDGVWVKIEKIELEQQNGSFVTIVNNPTGSIVNLREFGGAQNTFGYVGDDSVSSGSYTGARVTMDDEVTLFPTGVTTGQAKFFDGLAGGKKVIDITFSAPKSLSGSSNKLVLDFVLSQWTTAGNLVQNVVINDGSLSGIDDSSRHESEDYHGTVSGLTGTAPNLTFSLTSPHGVSMKVATSAATAIFNSNGQGNPVLANGAHVEVRGTFNPATGQLSATAVKIEDGNGSSEDPHEVRGVPSNPNLGAGTFTLTLRSSFGFVPTVSTFTVQTSASTRFRASGGLTLTQAQFFERLSTGVPLVEVEGTFNSGSGIFTAVKVKIEDDDDESHDHEAKGTASNINSGARTFTLALSSWEGFGGSSGQQLAVSAAVGATFRDDNGNSLSADNWFAALVASTTKRVEVKGAFSGSSFVGIRFKLEDANDDPHEMHGQGNNVNAVAFTFSVQVTTSEGFNIAPGTNVPVTTSPSTTFRNDNGDSMSREQFFAAMGTGRFVEVEGVYGSGTFAAVKCKFDDD